MYSESFFEQYQGYFFISWIVLVVICIAAGSEREIGWFWSLIVALLFSPVVGIIAIMCTPHKDSIFRQKRLVEQNDEIIALLTTNKSVLT